MGRPYRACGNGPIAHPELPLGAMDRSPVPGFFSAWCRVVVMTILINNHSRCQFECAAWRGIKLTLWWMQRVPRTREGIFNAQCLIKTLPLIQNTLRCGRIPSIAPCGSSRYTGERRILSPVGVANFSLHNRPLVSINIRR